MLFAEGPTDSIWYLLGIYLITEAFKYLQKWRDERAAEKKAEEKARLLAEETARKDEEKKRGAEERAAEVKNALKQAEEKTEKKLEAIAKGVDGPLTDALKSNSVLAMRVAHESQQPADVQAAQHALMRAEDHARQSAASITLPPTDGEPVKVNLVAVDPSVAGSKTIPKSVEPPK